MVLEVITMDKKKLKVLLGLLGFGLIVGAIVVAVVTGTIVYRDAFRGGIVTGYNFRIDHVEFQYVVPLLVAGIVSFIISSCIMTKSKNAEDKE